MKKAIALTIAVSIAITAVLRLHPVVTACIAATIILVLYRPASSTMLKMLNIAGGSSQEQAPVLLSDFDKHFGVYRGYNTSAFVEACGYLETFIELLNTSHSHQLYANICNMKTSCLNALHSIIISVDNRRDINSLGDKIAALDAQCDDLLSEYRQRLEKVPITTMWVPTDNGKIKPYLTPDNALSAYGWFI
jgi:hypothetical protein